MIQWKGTIIEESLSNKEFMKEVKVTSVRIVNIKSPAPGQSKTWHLYDVVVEGGRINLVTKKAKKSLKESP